MKKQLYRLIASALALSLASTLGIAALASDTTINFGLLSNNAPIAESLELETYRGVELTGSFKAFDPDGDALMFEITTAPRKGALATSGNHCFVYTPAEKSKGRDTFTYVAVDENGGVSANATVTINIKKQVTKTTYSDMSGNSAHNAAITLSERGIFTGERLGDECFFRPDAPVTRGEFLAMCLKMSDTAPAEGITRTGFSDDSDIPVWTKPYVSAALMNGIVGGSRNSEGALVFLPNSAITYAEAAVIINKTLGISEVVGVASYDSGAVPAWAQSAAANLTACAILPAGLAGISGDELTRSAAAELLVASMRVLDNREDASSGLLSWAK